jgi:hypothetical protein
MAGQTLLRSMTHEDLRTLQQNLMSNDPKAIESARQFLETCLNDEIKSASPDTRAATPEMFLEEISQILSEAQQPANAIVRFSRTPSLEQEFTAEFLNRNTTAKSL